MSFFNPILHRCTTSLPISSSSSIPESASAPPLCHWTLDSRLPTLLLGGLFNIGLCMAFNLSCLRFATLPWAPVPPPLAAARSRVCHGSLYGLPLLLTSSPDSAMCHFQVSLHC
ncbi:unnamed protein product, partial [Staurois parvus]